MGEDKECWCRERHDDHICVLKAKGLTHRMERETGTPSVACLNCGEEADYEEHVCMPVPLFI